MHRDNTTSLTLNYYGTEPVYVSIHTKQWIFERLTPVTSYIETMRQGDKEDLDLREYVTWMEVTYNNKEVRLEWKPVSR